MPLDLRGDGAGVFVYQLPLVVVGGLLSGDVNF